MAKYPCQLSRPWSLCTKKQSSTTRLWMTTCTMTCSEGWKVSLRGQRSMLLWNRLKQSQRPRQKRNRNLMQRWGLDQRCKKRRRKQQLLQNPNKIQYQIRHLPSKQQHPTLYHQRLSHNPQCMKTQSRNLLQPLLSLNYHPSKSLNKIKTMKRKRKRT